MKQFLNRFLEWALIILLGIMLFSVLWGVLTRYVFADQSSWTDELAIFMLIWVSMLGAAYVSGKNAHITIDLIPESISPKAQFRLKTFTSLLISCFVFAIFLIGGLRFVYVSFKLDQASAALGIPMGYVYLVLPIAGILIIYFKVTNILQARRELKLTN